MELQNGMPEDMTGRLPRETRVYDLLDHLGIGFERCDHEAANNMEACEAIDAVLGVRCVRICFFATDRRQAFLPAVGHSFQTVILAGE